jgi:hypothetical protein
MIGFEIKIHEFYFFIFVYFTRFTIKIDIYNTFHDIN